jgi:hypothetical protein
MVSSLAPPRSVRHDSDAVADPSASHKRRRPRPSIANTYDGPVVLTQSGSCTEARSGAILRRRHAGIPNRNMSTSFHQSLDQILVCSATVTPGTCGAT